ncbi:tetratricopeptide repeat protein [Flavobacterium sp. UBA4197]|uniref:tetratricopeptide repeat protein n=1 Tax=Flavobacterium sp. UBA4197 TaxID=1946546 RepID=UPI00257AAC92|nr:tetratricopeptide repeat protein [Flavobacterium sp. UBA4197]
MTKFFTLISIISFHLLCGQTLEEKIAIKSCECLASKSKLTEENTRECIVTSTTTVVFSDSDAKNREHFNTVDGIQNLFQKITAILPKTCDSIKKSNSIEKEKQFYTASKNEKAQNAYTIADDMIDLQKYDVAIESLLNAIKNDPKFVMAYDNLGLCYRQLKDYDKAIRYYKKSLEIYPEGTFALMNIGVAYGFKSDFKNAIIIYEKLKKYHPDNAEGYFGAGKNYFLINDYEKALDNIFTAHRIYTEEKSDYAKDTEQLIGIFYSKLKNENKEDVFKKIAEKHNIKLNE